LKVKAFGSAQSVQWPRVRRWRRRLQKLFTDNGLSIALFSLFVVCIVAQSYFGFIAYNDLLKQARLSPVSFAGFLESGTFLDGVFSNWQAAILQLTVLIGFSSNLRQRGAAHSRKARDEPKSGEKPEAKQKPDQFGRVSNLSKLYKSSLSIAFTSVFIVLFVIHSVTGWRFNNENLAIAHLPSVGFLNYVASSSFWFSVFQTWEAEFFAIAIYIVASIFLRQKNSPESKKPDAPNVETGDTNE
jgi:hypothetical protein